MTRQVLLWTLWSVLVLFGLPAKGVWAQPLWQQGGVPIYGLQGSIQLADQRPFDDFFLAADGETYGIAGVDSAVELELIRLRNRRPPVQVKIWGVLSTNTNDVSRRQIVVTEILVVNGSGQGGEIPQLISNVPVLNVRSGPGTGYDRVGQVFAGEAYDILGRTEGERSWWMLCCVTGSQKGWVFADLVTIQGDTDSVPVVASSSSPVEPDVYQGWKTSYFANPDLRSPVIAFADAPAINFNWGVASPFTGVPADNFSVRFERTIDFPADLYQFNVQADDGVRVWLDSQPVIDEWHGATGRTYTHLRQLSGRHALRVEFQEVAGNASVRFWYEQLAAGAGEWRAAYYNGISLSGDPLLVQIEPPLRNKLHRDWGLDSPLPGVIPADNWSGRWRGVFHFEPGDYLFTARVDDGVSIWLNGHTVIREWNDGVKAAEVVFENIGQGDHNLTVEYYERGGLAALDLNWLRLEREDMQP